MPDETAKTVHAVPTHQLDGMTTLDAIVVREGKNIKGWFSRSCSKPS
jgi:hypothetical protein